MPSVKPSKKPIKLGPVAGVLLLPLLLVGGVLSIPFTMVWGRVKSRRERRFANTMKADGRIIEWERFISELNAGHGTLIVERFSFKGPIRLWWTREDVYEVCPYPLVDWLTMTRETSFDVYGLLLMYLDCARNNYLNPGWSAFTKHRRKSISQIE